MRLFTLSKQIISGIAPNVVGQEGTDTYKLKGIADLLFSTKFSAISEKVKQAIKDCAQ